MLIVSRSAYARLPGSGAVSGRSGSWLISPRIDLGVAAGVEQPADGVLGVVREVPIGAVDGLHRCAHQAGELEDAHAGGERLRRECVPQVVRAALADPGGFERGVPLAGAPRVEA